jgi:hypothetical protein
MQNTQILQIFTKIIKTKKYLQKFLKCQGEGLGSETSGLIKMGKEVQAL